MNLETFFSPALTESLALTLFHFLWQGSVIALLASLASLLFLRKSTPSHRYNFFVCVMLSLVICIPLTLAWTLQNSEHPAESEDHSIATQVFEEAIYFPSKSEDFEDEALTSSSDAEIPIVESEDFVEANPMQTSTEELADVSALSPVTNSPDSIGDSASEALPKPAGILAEWRVYAPYVTLLYLGGVLVMALRLLLAVQGGRRLRRNSVQVDDATILAYLSRKANEIGLATAPLVAYSHAVTVPTVVGIVKPFILLPASIGTGFTPQQIELFLVHELCHIRRYDHLVNLLQRIVEALLFFHPAVWYISSQIRLEREHCCDDLVVKIGGDSTAYAASLVRAAEVGKAIATRSTSLAATGNPSQLQRRVRRILGTPPTPFKLARPSVAVLACVVSLTLLTVAAMARTEPEEEATTSLEPLVVSMDLPIEESDPAESLEAFLVDNADVELAEPFLLAQEVPPTPEQQELLNQYGDSDDFGRLAIIHTMGKSGDAYYVPFLLKILPSGFFSVNSRARREIVNVLGSLGDPAAIRPLVSEFRWDNEKYRDAVVEALKQLDDSQVLEYLSLALEDSAEKHMRSNVAYALTKLDTPEAARLLEESLKDENLRWVVARALWENGRDENILAFVEERVASENIDEARMAALFFERAKDDRLVPFFVRLSNHSDPEIRRAGIMRLSFQESEDAMSIVENALLDSDAKIATQAAQILKQKELVPTEPKLLAAYYVFTGNVEVAATLGDHAIEPLQVALNAQGPFPDQLHLIALGSVGNDSTVPFLASYLQNQNKRFADSALEALTKIGTLDAATRLMDALANPNEEVRRDVLYRIGTLGHPVDIERIQTSLKDLSQDVRAAAAYALGELGDESAIPALIEALQDDSFGRRGDLVRALGTLEAQEAVPELLRLLEKDWSAQEVLETLVNIGDTSVVSSIEAYVMRLAERVEAGLTSEVSASTKIKTARWAYGKLGEHLETARRESRASSASQPKAEQLSDEELEKQREAAAKFVDARSQLVDPDWWLRKVAAQQLGDVEDDFQSEAVQLLIKALKDEDAKVASAAAISLGTLKDPMAIKHLVASLKETQQVSTAASAALLTFNEAETLPLLTLAIRDGYALLGRRAAMTLREMHSPEALKLLVEASANPDLSPMLTEHLANSESWDEVKTQLARILTSEDPLARKGALSIIAKHGGQESETTLIEVARNAPRDDRIIAIRLLDTFPSEDVTELFITLLQDEDFGMRYHAAHGLTARNYLPKSRDDLARFYVALQSWDQVRSMGAVALDPLLAALAYEGLDDVIPQPRGRVPRSSSHSLSRVVGLLGGIGDEKATEPLITVLEEAESSLARNVIQALAQIGDERAIPACIRALEGTNSAVRLEAVKTLSTFDGELVLDSLIGALRDVESSVRREAAYRLGKKADVRAAEALSKAVLDIESDVRRSAIRALGEIGPAAFPALDAVYDEIPASMHASVIENALIKMGPNVDKRLIQILESSDTDGANYAAMALERYNTPEVIVGLVSVLKSNDASKELKQEIVVTLGRLGGTHAVEALMSEHGKEENTKEYNQQIAFSLAKIGDSRALPILEAAAGEWSRGLGQPQSPRTSVRRARPGPPSLRLEKGMPENETRALTSVIEKMRSEP